MGEHPFWLWHLLAQIDSKSVDKIAKAEQIFEFIVDIFNAFKLHFNVIVAFLISASLHPNMLCAVFSSLFHFHFHFITININALVHVSIQFTVNILQFENLNSIRNACLFSFFYQTDCISIH